MKKIGIIVRSLSGGGAERVVSNISMQLCKKYCVHLIVFDGNNISYPYEGKLHNLYSKPTKNICIKITNLIKRILSVRKIIRTEGLECVLSFASGPNLVNACMGKKVKKIISIRNDVSKQRISKMKYIQIKFSCMIADRVVALSEMVKYQLVNEYHIHENKVEVIYNSVDGNKLNEFVEVTCDELNINSRYIITMGRLAEQKGQWHLIRAFKDVIKEIPDLKLVILGEGKLRTQLCLLIEKLGIQEHVIMPGFINNPHAIIKESELFVLPSIYEGLGNVLLEALAFGKMIISTDCIAGPREILAPKSDLRKTINRIENPEYAEYGILIPRFDEKIDIESSEITEKEQELAKIIVQVLVNNKIKKEYENKTAEALYRFIPDVISNKWNEVIEDVMQS